MRYDQTTITRPQRVGLLIGEEIGRMLADSIKDPRIGLVTVTDVHMSGDLRNGTVYVSVYGDEQAQQGSIEALNDARGFIRRELAHRLTLRHIPNLTFRLDNTLAQAMKMDRLLRHLNEEERPQGEEIPTEYAPVETPRDRTPAEKAPVPAPARRRRGMKMAGRSRYGSRGKRGKSRGR